ncbi:unnamed protein product, partial [marine sediment metagenome]
MGKNIKFRPKSSFLPNTEEEREALKARQKAGQKKYYENRASLKAIGVKKEVQKNPFAPDYKDDIIKYLQDQYYLIETHEPVILEAWQKTRIFEPLFKLNEDGLRKFSLAVIGLPKKNSKSTMASMVANYFLFQDE